MKTHLNMDKIALVLGVERAEKVSATDGYFGAMQLLADIEARFSVPTGGRFANTGGPRRTDAARGPSAREDNGTDRRCGRAVLPYFSRRQTWPNAKTVVNGSTNMPFLVALAMAS